MHKARPLITDHTYYPTPHTDHGGCWTCARPSNEHARDGRFIIHEPRYALGCRCQPCQRYHAMDRERKK